MTHAVSTSLTYDDLHAGHWYTVSGYDQNLYLREKRRIEGVYTFTRSGDGPRGSNVIIIRDIAYVGCETNGPLRWFVPTGNINNDLDRLLMLLVDSCKEDEDEFTKWVDGTRVNGVLKAYQSINRYPTIASFAQDCDRYTDWLDQSSEALVEIRERREVSAYRATLPAVQVLPEKDFRAHTAGIHEVGRAGDILEYDRPFCFPGAGLWTDSMGTCVTVGFTALSPDSKTRYNTLLHSFFSEHKGTAIIRALQGLFTGMPGLPAYDKLKDVAYYVVGGYPEVYSRRKVAQVLEVLRERELRVLGVHLTDRYADAKLAKAVLITAEGKVAATQYPVG